MQRVLPNRGDETRRTDFCGRAASLSIINWRLKRVCSRSIGIDASWSIDHVEVGSKSDAVARGVN